MPQPTTQPQPVLRFAPSPNGRLHLGHARSACIGFDVACRLGGRFLLRIEDIDLSRTREEFVSAIFEDLRWLGLSWEEPVLRQSQHFADYQAAADKLKSLGLLYPCFATRSEIIAAQSEKTDPDGAPLYPGLHKHLGADEILRRIDAGELFAMRLHMDRAIAHALNKAGSDAFAYWELDEDLRPNRTTIDPARWGDVILQRKDVPTSYHLSVVVDDARQGITHVVRGRDLQLSTDVHRLLQILLDLPEPRYHHHALVLDASGRKLAKSAGDTAIAELRRQGFTPLDIRRLAGVARSPARDP